MRDFERTGIVLLALLGMLCGCGSPEEERLQLAPETPVVLISIDTLRADRLPLYGYTQVATPAIDAVRRDGILYERAYSHIPLTLPAHSSLLTGLLPPAHGLRDNVGYILDAERIASGEIPFLPRALKARGYATGAAISSFVLRSKTGLNQDFEFYEDSIEFHTGTGIGGLQRPGSTTLRLARDWLRSVADRPFFFFFHIYEPHTPYQPPEPFASRYASPYDGEVAAADQVIGELVAELQELGIYDRALIVLLSDHGEGLEDHGETEHGVLLYTTTLHVPLILKLPRAELAGATATAPVQLIDVFPTILTLLGLPVPAQLRGGSLLDFVDPEAPVRRIYSETFYPRLHFGWNDLASLIDDRYHYIEGPDPELYAIGEDPGEEHNVLRDRRRIYAELRDELAQYERSLSAPAAADEESRQALAALGYIGSAGGDLSGPLPDPKSRLNTLTDLMAGFRLHSQREHRKAVDAFRRALRDNPQMLDAWEYLARSLQKLGEWEEALSAYQEALKISNGSPHLAISAASLYFDLGRLEEAESHARLALKTHSSFAHGLLAQIALEREDFDEAERQARLALDEKDPRLGPTITLAGVLHARGEYEEALEMTRRTEETFAQREAKDPELIKGLYLQKGKILADLGEVKAAEAAFLKEIELHPDQIYTYSNLAILYALTGRQGEVGGVLRRMVEARPSPDAYAEAVKTLRVLELTPGAVSLLRYALGLYPESEKLRELAEES
ncbi:MAG: sulfatase-like hydrolase/transferase [bacterium]|nr:sulfatase-like hydrolase/transferase [bacterium]